MRKRRSIAGAGIFLCFAMASVTDMPAGMPATGPQSAFGEEVVARAHRTGDERRVDNPVDAWLSVHSGPAGEPVEGGFERRFNLLDATDARAGDFSVTFEVTEPGAQGAFGFFTGPYIDRWSLDEDFTLHLQLKAGAEGEPQRWRAVLYDARGARAEADLEDMAADGQWRRFALPLVQFDADEGFDFASLRSVQVEAALAPGARIWLDDVYFERGEEILGVSDKTITQHMAEADATRERRVEEKMSAPVAPTAHSSYFLPQLWNADNLEETNREIMEYIEEGRAEGVARDWSLFTSSALNYMYFGFSSQGRLKPGRLSDEVEEALLEWMWERTRVKNDIATARRSSWYMAGSENHDINAKMFHLLTSQIFMHEPDYADRIYPNLGRMIGYDYMLFGLRGSGDFSDGRDYRPADHYEAWVEFWKEFFAERARHGFFLEHNANTYMSHTNRFLNDIYAWVDDEDLRKQTRMFLDLMWAQWVQDHLFCIQGGAGTRGWPGWGRMGIMAQFYLGGPATGEGQVFGDYRWPRAVWEMALDQQGRGEYAFVSRKPNEAQHEEPRPAGTELTILSRPDSRIVRYSWVTPDYVMGSRMDHPNAVYCHLSHSGQGIIFPTSPNARIEFGARFKRGVQERNVAVMQPKDETDITTQHPPWFPGWKHADATDPIEVWFGPDIDGERIVERDGWVFVEEGNAFAAFRVVAAPVLGRRAEELQDAEIDAEGFRLLEPEEKSYSWSDEPRQLGRTGTHRNRRQRGGRLLVADEDHAALIVETSRRAHHATFEEFQDDILGNPLHLRQIITGYTLTYRGCGEDARELYLNCSNSETPKIDGEYISYDSPAFDSPWLKGEFGSGVVTLTGPVSGEELVLDFN